MGGDAVESLVLLSMNEFDALVAAGERTLDTLTTEFDELLDRMQTPGARKGMADAFSATPDRLGKAAVRGEHRDLRPHHI
jgi:antitoxin Phd